MNSKNGCKTNKLLLGFLSYQLLFPLAVAVGLVIFMGYSITFSDVVYLYSVTFSNVGIVIAILVAAIILALPPE